MIIAGDLNITNFIDRLGVARSTLKDMIEWLWI